jgi:hypothetical protein
MLRDPRRHSVRQTVKQYRELEKVPDLKRPEHFIHDVLEGASRKARRIAKLKPEANDDGLSAEKIASLVKRLEENADTLDKTRTALEKLKRASAKESSRRGVSDQGRRRRICSI